MDIILVLGVVLASAFFAGKLADRVRLPVVTGYVLMGVVLGPSAAGIVGSEEMLALEPINAFALGLIGLSIGSELRWRSLLAKWENFGLLFAGQSMMTLLLVFLSIYLFSGDIPMAIMLGVLALAPAPATILGVIREYRTRGPFPREIMSMVVLDSLWCITAFTIVSTVLNFYYFGNGTGLGALGNVFGQIAPAIGLGIILGACGILVIDRISIAPQRQVMITAILLLSVGIPRHLGISYLLVTLITGVMVVNLSPNFERFVGSLRTIDTPILVVFLTLAGTRLQLDVLPMVGRLGVVYVLARFAGKMAGARIADLGCRLLPDRCGLINPKHRRLMGMALTPQAGVAVGLSILAEQQLPVQEGLLVSLVLGSVIISQLIAPTLIVRALRMAGAIVTDG